MLSKICPLLLLIIYDRTDGPGQFSGFICNRPSPCGIIYQKGKENSSSKQKRLQIIIRLLGQFTASTIISEAAPHRSTACALASVVERER